MFMKLFLGRLLGFATPIILVMVVGLMLPATPRVSKSLLFAGVQKDRLLQTVESPRIIFVGGSNLSFGLNCQLIKDSLALNPINTAIHASIGLRFMLENTLQYVKEGDIVVLIPEYNQLFRDYDASAEELMRMVFDVDFSKVALLSPSQAVNLIAFTPKYVVTKFKPSEYRHLKANEFYGVDSFNEYGDVYTHWGKPRVDFPILNRMSTRINPGVIRKLQEYQSRLAAKNATFLISFPGLQDLSYDKSVKSIEVVANAFAQNGFAVLGRPERYRIPDRMMFNTPYHLNKEGVDYRTRLFIEDFREYERTQQARIPTAD
jgi:hypothetical protein